VEPTGARPTLLLSVDFEDWHQLARRRVGSSNWPQPGPALGRQTQALLSLLDEIGARATFFVLGMAARAHPGLLEAIIERGHEIGSHGDEHQLVHTQTREQFAADLSASRETIIKLTGREPVGYRAPAFSITRETAWAYDVLFGQGFAYDASEHDTPRVRDRARPVADGPHALEGGIWEFPVAVWRTRQAVVPVGGASYWALMPECLVLHGLERAGRYAGLYLHPHELDPEPLRIGLPLGTPIAQRLHGSVRAAQRNSARKRTPNMMRAIAKRFHLIPYGEAYAQLHDGAGARS
jgi:polysaccharide deacetylase family protein (PEP-CTERM system associated)